MKIMKAASVEDFRTVSNFQTVRKQLMEDKYADRLERPLAYWALPNDRRLPLALLGRSIKELLETPFEELSATPGIGQKKINSLVKLLNRATKDHPPGVTLSAVEAAEKKPVEKSRKGGKFDPAIVSEALWTEWCATVRKHGIGNTKLGRVAPTLQNLPTVIWHTPIEEYLDHTVTEIRSMKRHGEKRVRVILEVFSVAYDVLAAAGTDETVSLRLMPKFIEPLERWIREKLSESGVPSVAEVREKFTLPLLHQLQIDAGPVIHKLAVERLGTEGAPQTVRHQAKRLGITRARVYQLLEECEKIMLVRWPEGEWMLRSLKAKFVADAKESDDLKMFSATAELFYPGKNRIVEEDGSLNAAEE